MNISNSHVTNISGKVEVDILLTNRCNLSCSHCLYTDEKDKIDLPYITILRLFDQLDSATTDIHLLGGEPLCRIDIVKIVKAAFDRGLHCQILTNGYNLNEKLLLNMKKGGLKSIGFSVDGTEKDHNINRVKDDAFKKVINAIKCAARNGYSPKVSTAVHIGNVKSIPEMVINLNDIGVKRILIEYVLPIGRGRQITGQNLTPLEWQNLRNNLKEVKEKRKLEIRIAIQTVFMENNGSNMSDFVEDEKICVCKSGKLPVVDGFGNYYPCIILYAAKCPQGSICSDQWKHLNSKNSISVFVNKIWAESDCDNGNLKILCPAVKIMIKQKRLEIRNLYAFHDILNCFHKLTII